jgi:CheY-like chemotaxis protein
MTLEKQGSDSIGQTAQTDDPEFDPHFKIFHELMAIKIREILLVSSPYDAYIMEEDGSLATRLIYEYHGLNLSQPPRITRAATAEQALGLLERGRFDLLVTMPHLSGMDGCAFRSRVKELYPDLPLVLLSHSVKDTFFADSPDHKSCIDSSFVWCCDSNLLLAVVKSVEDEANVDHDTRLAMVRVILLVEDSALHRSNLLPILYNELVQQTQSVLDEGLNEQHRLLKMRARPKVLTASSYEEALALFERYRPYIFAVMSDVRFPRNGKVDKRAGFDLLMTLRQQVPDLPLLMLSTDPNNRKLAQDLPAVFIEKDSDRIGEKIHDFFLRYLGFGYFVFRSPDGKEVGRANSLFEFEEMLGRIPLDSVVYHARHNHFSNWVMARAEVALASRLHMDHCIGFDRPEELREDLIRKVHVLRRIRQRGVVLQFSNQHFDPRTMDFVRIGQGSMGGKARGVAFIASRLQQATHEHGLLVQANVKIPQTCVIATSGFEEFVAKNNLGRIKHATDDEIGKAFLAARMPHWLEDDLRAFLAKVHWPLAIRSSSMLEDAQFRPYAGLYATFMLRNDADNFDDRLRDLIRAVKLVYASTWFEEPKAFSRSIGQTREDAMAVIIQQLIGSCYGDHFYPAISGVVQSYNYYPVGNMRQDEGIAQIAIGFGRTVVEGEQSLRFSPVYPQNLPQFSTVDDILANSQRWFYSLPFAIDGPRTMQQTDLVRREVDRGADESAIRQLSSTYDPQEHRIRDSDLPGPKVMTFAPLLKYGAYPLPEVLTILSDLGKQGMGCEVEVEFAIDLADPAKDSTFYFLQVRPIVTAGEQGAVAISEREKEQAFLWSSQSLGHGRIETISDVVYVRPESFLAAKTKEIAGEIGRINRQLHREGRPFLLIGPGRWGTADPWLGIPVIWSEISGVEAIVELQGYGMDVEPSQGSHFFQNITSLGIPYLMVEDAKKGQRGPKTSRISWSWLKKQEVVVDQVYTRHVHTRQPLLLKVDGRSGEAVCLAAQKNG